MDSEVKEVEERSIGDDLRAAFAEAKARQTEGGGEGTAAASEVPKTPDASKPAASANSDAGQSAQGGRDQSGRFAKPAAQQGEKTGVQDAQGAEAAKPVTVKAPDGLTADEKATFATLDPKMQAAWSRREAELTRKISTNDDERLFGRKIKDAAQPYAAVIAAEGGDVHKAFNQFLNYAYILRQGTPQQKAAALQAVARQYGVQVNSQPQQGQQTHPAIESLQQRLDRMDRDRQAEVTQRQQSQLADLQSEIDAFSSQPGHEHFEAVKPAMSALLQGGQAKDLQDAYEQAIWANTGIRSTLISAQTAQAQEKRVSEQTARAEAAKKAAGSVIGAPGGAKAPANSNGGTGNLRDDIRAAIRTVQGGRI